MPTFILERPNFWLLKQETYLEANSGQEKNVYKTIRT